MKYGKRSIYVAAMACLGFAANAGAQCGAGAGDCCTANGTPGCEDVTCCEAICAVDPFCCDTAWDSICAEEALNEPACAAACGGTCSNDICSPDGTWGADIDADGEISNFTAANGAGDPVFESILYDSLNGAPSRRVGDAYSVISGPNLKDHSSSTTLRDNTSGVEILLENEMIDGASGGALVTATVTNTNVGGDVSVKLFYYVDLDINGDFGDDEATTIDSITAIQQGDNGTTTTNPLWIGCGGGYASWSIQTFSSLRAALDDGLTELDGTDSTSPGAADHTAALSSPTLVLGPGQSGTVNFAIGGVDIACEGGPSCDADLDGNGTVGPGDLAIVLGNWGPCPGCPADLNGDGVVGPGDLAIALGTWGPCP